MADHVRILRDFHKGKSPGITLEGLEAGTAAKGDITSGIRAVLGNKIYGKGCAEIYNCAAASLEKVTGGAKTAASGKTVAAANTLGAVDASSDDEDVQLMRMECPYCHEIFRTNVLKTYAKCPYCHKTIQLKG